ncbi:MAG: hypothetical protein IJ343_05850 [Clostridia bacterium]|nr:hypothetical protein [Clostridia bacterium]
MKRIVLLLLAASMILSGSLAFGAADGSSNVYQGYTFDFFGNIKSTPAAFTLSQVLTEGVVIRTNSKGQVSANSFPFSVVADVCTAPDGRIFIADSNLETGRVYIFNPDGSMATVYDENGEEISGINPINTVKAINEKGRAAAVKLDAQGCLIQTDPNGKLCKLDANGNTIMLADQAVLLEKGLILKNEKNEYDLADADNPLVKKEGNTFIIKVDPQGNWIPLGQKDNLTDKGATANLKGCEGVFYHEKSNELFVADTANQRIIVLDGSTYLFKRAYTKPENMTGDTEFKPAKLVVDNADRIYVVVKSSYEGIIELNEDGSFSRYFGVNERKVNLLDIFWRSLYTAEQKADADKIYAPAFSNIALDGEGFVMAVTSDAAADKSVFRLNFAGANVLREMGNTLVVGDISTTNPSAFTDIAIKPYGAYALLDKTRGRVFIYNFDGELLTVFGSLGSLDGQFKVPTGIAWLGDKLLITDSGLKCVYVYEPTDFGQALLDASEAYYYGRWDEATENFEEVLRLCSNLETAYTGIGKNKLMQEDYEEAMRYFKLGNNREFYSKAYKGYRSIVMKENFGVIAVIAVVAIGAVLWSEVSYHRKQRRLYK